MTALSLSLFLPDSHAGEFRPTDTCNAEELEEAALNARHCRAFLLSLEFHLLRRWRRYSHQIGSSAPTRQHVRADLVQQYFPGLPVEAKRHASPNESNKPTFVGSGASGQLRDFIYRLLCHSRCSIECYPLALALSDVFFITLREKRLLAMEYEAAVNHLPCVFAVLLLLVAKCREDRIRSNRYFSQLVELPLGEWNALERLVFRVLQYDVRVPVSEYIAYEKVLLEDMAQREDEINASYLCRHPCPMGYGTSWVYRKDAVIGVEDSSDYTEGATQENSSFNSCGATATPPFLYAPTPTEDSPTVATATATATAVSAAVRVSAAGAVCSRDRSSCVGLVRVCGGAKKGHGIW
ncbi:putative CYC2-like cyclin 6 [Trypanosoma grayi]|uniref:putative CYC2-like cyclin 6 n=1 Tax=Trypanosoma grayi TaxID=71804 RepID=UPI0004F4B528|nr:putative CYC2-like cyclin 6 [Trypanosoma grayi]KEG14187.1 putative CYC2-like cyclin 6 [Trypanosoma grayi]